MSILEMMKCKISIVDHEPIVIESTWLNEQPPRKDNAFVQVSFHGGFLSISCESLVEEACLNEIPHCMWWVSIPSTYFLTFISTVLCLSLIRQFPTYTEMLLPSL